MFGTESKAGGNHSLPLLARITTVQWFSNPDFIFQIFSNLDLIMFWMNHTYSFSQPRIHFWCFKYFLIYWFLKRVLHVLKDEP